MDPYKRGVVNLRDSRLIDTVTLTALRSLISLSMTYPWSPIKWIDVQSASAVMGAYKPANAERHERLINCLSGRGSISKYTNVVRCRVKRGQQNEL